MGSRKRLLFNVCFSVVALMLLEAIARVAAWKYHPFARINPAVIADPVIHHTYVPSFTAEGLPYALHINRQSWPEDRDIVQRKRPGVFRIFMVGDSNTQGYVDPAARWVTLVGNTLNERADHGLSAIKSFEVVNAGRVSYSPLLYYLHIRDQILRFSPDLVVINVDMSDCRDDAVYRLLMQTNDVGEVLAVLPRQDLLRSQGLIMTPSGVRRLTVGEKAVGWCVERSTFLKFLQMIATRIAGRFIGSQKHQDSNVPSGTPGNNGITNVLHANWLETPWSADVKSNVAFSMTMLEKSIELLRENGVDCLIVGVPHYSQFIGQGSTRPFEELADVAHRQHVLFLNLYEALAPKISNAGQTEYYQLGDPVHFNERGNQLWADAFLAFWERNQTSYFAK